MGPSDPSDSNPTSKQGFIRSKQQLQQFAPPTSILLNFILRRGDQTVHKHEGTGKERGAGKKSERVGGGGDDDGGGEGLREGGDGKKRM